MISLIDHFLNMPALLVRRSQSGTADRYGTPAWVETSVDVMTWVHPASSEEMEERPAGIVKHWAYFAPGVDVSTLDRLIVDGYAQLEVAGPPLVWKHPMFDSGFQRVPLVEVEETGS